MYHKLARSVKLLGAEATAYPQCSGPGLADGFSLARSLIFQKIIRNDLTGGVGGPMSWARRWQWSQRRENTPTGEPIMADTSYIPAKDADFRNWATVFASSLSANPALFMMTPAEAAGVQDAVDNFVAAYQIAITPETRTKQTIIDKDDARSICESLCRQYAILIKENAGITDGDKVNAGVRPVNPDREPIFCPTTPPLLNILGNLPGTQTLRFSDSTTPDSKAKPFGASELQLFLAIGTEEPAPISSAQFYGKFTRNPIEVDFTEADDKKTATYYARWASQRGEVGPWSLPVTMTIAA
jgi:hypothetical protein